MTKLLFVLTYLLGFSTGLIHAQPAAKHYNFSKKEPKAKEVLLSSVPSDINYIALQTPSGVFVARAHSILQIPNHLLVLDGGNMNYVKLFVFGLDGSFKSLIPTRLFSTKYLECKSKGQNPYRWFLTLFDIPKPGLHSNLENPMHVSSFY